MKISVTRAITNKNDASISWKIANTKKTEISKLKHTQQMKKHTANLVIHQKNRKDVLNSFPNYSEATITYHRFQMTERKRRNVVFIWWLLFNIQSRCEWLVVSNNGVATSDFVPLFFLSLLSFHLFLVVVAALSLSFISLLLFTGNEIEKEMCALRIESSEHWNRQRIEWIHLFLILVKSM